jgi:hypothetical protein
MLFFFLVAGSWFPPRRERGQDLSNDGFAGGFQNSRIK